MIGIIAADIFHVAQVNNDVSRRSRSIRQGFCERGKHDHMSVREQGKIVVDANHGDIAFRASGSSESRIELRSVHLPDHIVAKVHFLEDAVGAVGLAAETDQKMTIRKQFNRVWAWISWKGGLVSPKNVAG